MLGIFVPLLSLALHAGPVHTEQGEVTGVPSGGVTVYKGIPYATPPIGELRWKEPQRPMTWKGVRKAAEFSAPCMQTPYPVGSLYRSELPTTSEDCLYLNIWTAAKAASEKRPVMVWIHGGALTRGTGATPTYNGERFAQKGVVLVTINYRLGIFGFFSHPELTAESKHHASGNQGLLDQVAALEWIHRNIAAFGGDPNNVTIFGESAGLWSVNALTASPLTKGMIHRVIGESGAVYGPMITREQGERSGQGKGTLQELRAKSAEELLKANPSIALAVVDGYALPRSVREIFEDGKQNDIPLIAGYNADEATAFLPGLTAEAAAKSYDSDSRERYGNLFSDFVNAYPAENPQQKRKAMLDVWRDTTFGWQMRTWARLQTRTGKAPAYLYFFSRVPPGPLSAKFGAYHASEIAYVFGTLSPAREWEAADQQLSEAIMNYWVNFAKTGNPNGKGLPDWPQYQKDQDVTIEFGNAVALRKDLNKRGLDFLDRVFQANPRGFGR